MKNEMNINLQGAGHKLYVSPACRLFAMELRAPLMENSFGGNATDEGADGGWGLEGGDPNDGMPPLTGAAYHGNIWDEDTIFD